MRLIILFTLIIFTSNVFSHGDHSAPGALPFPPRGGKVAELVSTSQSSENGKTDSHEGHDHDKHEDHADHKEHDHDKHEDHADHDGHDGHDHDKHEDHADHDGHDHEEHAEHEGHNHEKHEDHADHDSHDQQEKNEYFIEAVYKNGLLKIYPIALSEKSTKEFSSVKILKDKKIKKAEILFPRSKKKHTVEMEQLTDKNGNDFWQSIIPHNKDIRFFATLTINWQGEELKSQVHLEKKQ